MIPGQLYPIPFLPMFPGGMPFSSGGGYDPNDSLMDMRPKYQRTPMLPRSQQEENGLVRVSGELPVIQDLTPAIARDPTDTSSTDNQPQTHDSPTMSNGQIQSKSSTQQIDDTQQTFSGVPLISFMPTDMGMGNSHRGGYRGRGRGRGRGIFDGEVHNFRPERRDSKTLVVEKIPEDKLSLENVNDWFKRFGSVTNVAIDKAGGKALVSFSSHDEAHAAWKSEDAVFNNRFVKVFWHRPMEGQGQMGARMLAASADVVANLTTNPNSTPSVPMPLSLSTSTKTKTASTPATSALAAKQQQLEQQISEQKTLMASLDSAMPEQKKNIMMRLRKLDEEMRTTSTTPLPSVSQPSSKIPSSVTDNKEKEKRVRERLNKELELHGTTDGTTDGTTGPPSSAPASTEKQETTEELKAKLEKLQAEVRSILLY